MTNYDDLINKLTDLYPEFDITMGTTNTLKTPAIIISLDGITSEFADDDVHAVMSATYLVTFYVESTASFNPIPAARLFGNLSQISFDRMADGEMFQSSVTLRGSKALWGE